MQRREQSQRIVCGTLRLQTHRRAMPTLPSQDPDARNRPSGAQDTLVTPFECPRSSDGATATAATAAAGCWRVAGPATPAQLPLPAPPLPAPLMLPVLDTTDDLVDRDCSKDASGTRTVAEGGSPEAEVRVDAAEGGTDQSRRVWSWEAVAIRWPSGENATAHTWEWESRRRNRRSQLGAAREELVGWW